MEVVLLDVTRQSADREDWHDRPYLRASLTIALLLVTAIARHAGAQTTAAPPEPAAKQPAADCDKLRDRSHLDPQDAIAAALKCVGWLRKPGDGQSEGRVTFLAPVETGSLVTLEVEGNVPEVADEFLSLVVEIAVERAKHEGLALVKRRIETGVCELRLAHLEGNKHVAGDALLPATCALIRSTDLQALVGQGRALKAALTADVVHNVETLALSKIEDLQPLARGARAALALVRRFADDPDAKLTRNDVWLVVDAVLNTPCERCDDSYHTFQLAMKAARTYIEAVRLSKPDAPPIDLAEILRRVIRESAPISSAQYAIVVDYTNLIVRAALATTSAGSVSHRDAVRDVLRVIFEVVTTNGNVGANPDTFKVPAWAKGIAQAALDGDAPRLIAALSQMATANLIHTCIEQVENGKSGKPNGQPTDKVPGGDCQAVRKFAALLTGIATYAMTYEAVPSDLSADQRAAMVADRRQARKEALEAVIDAATDRSGRGGAAVWSLGINVGMAGSRLKFDASTGATNTVQLQAPVSISFQQLPGDNRWKGAHLAFSFLELGNYVSKTDATTTRPDWRSILAPGVQAAWAIRGPTPSNLFLVGVSYSYAAQFNRESAPTSGFRGAHRVAGFVSYYVPLWDFN